MDTLKMYKINKDGRVSKYLISHCYKIYTDNPKCQPRYFDNLNDMIKENDLVKYEEIKGRKIKMLEEELGIKLQEVE